MENQKESVIIVILDTQCRVYLSTWDKKELKLHTKHFGKKHALITTYENVKKKIIFKQCLVVKDLISL